MYDIQEKQAITVIQHAQWTAASNINKHCEGKREDKDVNKIVFLRCYIGQFLVRTHVRDMCK